MESLFEQKDRAKFSASLSALEPLISRMAVGFQDIAIELLRVLLHLEDRFSLQNFSKIRLSTMKAIVVKLPEQGAVYLTSKL